MNLQPSTFNFQRPRNGAAAFHWVPGVGRWMLLVFLIISLFAFSATAEPGVVDTTASPFAKIRTVGLGETRWTDGFWADRFELCRTQMVPSMGRLMEGTNYSQFFRNFEIAAGLAGGKSRGATFNDGDFYKWLEGAGATLAVTNDAALRKNWMMSSPLSRGRRKRTDTLTPGCSFISAAAMPMSRRFQIPKILKCITSAS